MKPPVKADQSLKNLATEQLRAEFRRCMTLTAEHLVRLAYILHLIESRGETVDAPSGLLNVLRKIADGKLLPEAVLKFSGYPRVLAKIGTLPVTEQKKILADEDRQAELLRQKRPPSENGHRATRPERQSPFVATGNATVKDLAGLLLEMIENHPEPVEVWKALQALARKTWPDDEP